MDSMYQVAIEEMVEKAFSAADVNKDGKITYEEFRFGLPSLIDTPARLNCPCLSELGPYKIRQ